MDPETPTRLVLIRHGESNSTVDRVVGGHRGCTGLSERGRRQAEALCRRLAATGELGPSPVVMTSVLPRAIETAEILSSALGGAAAEQDCDLCEIHPGEGDGLTWEEFQERYRPGDPAARDPYTAAAPGGESWASFYVRVGTALRRLAEKHRGETVVIVCHGGVIEGSFAALGNQPLRRPFDVGVVNTSITEWELRSPGDGEPARGERWKLVRFNDAAHLHGVD